MTHQSTDVIVVMTRFLRAAVDLWQPAVRDVGRLCRM
jgi:hypothetical protein